MTVPTVFIHDGARPQILFGAPVQRAVKLGRIRPTHIVETASHRVLTFADGTVVKVLKLAPYLALSARVSAIPDVIDWHSKLPAVVKQMYGNDSQGDCVIASLLKQWGIWTGNELGTPALATDQEALSQYHSICGAGDNGCIITAVLDVAKGRGLTVGGVVHRIDNYVAVDWTNKVELMTALELFGSLKIGLNLPSAWQCTNCTWDVTSAQIVGGHDVPICGANAQGVQILTWAGLVTITWAAFLSKTWVEECYAELAPDWYSKGNLAPNGIDAATLANDLVMLGNGAVPPLPGPTPPPIQVCPVGYHWDAAQGNCMPDSPTPPPPPPVPQTFTVHVPKQPVLSKWGAQIGVVPAFTVQGALGKGEEPSLEGVHVPPWVLPIIQGACNSGVVLPAPWNILMEVVCKAKWTSPPGATASPVHFPLPSWVVPLLRLLCGEVHLLPEQCRVVAAALCHLIPEQGALPDKPCGGCGKK